MVTIVDDRLKNSILEGLDKPICIIGMMGAGKTKIGALIAESLELGFVDSDNEVEQAAGCTIVEIFERYGEKAFRDGEKRVIKRLISEDIRVLSTGGGSIMTQEIADLIWDKTLSIWVKADISVILERVARSDKRPLLNDCNPEKILNKMVKERYPVYSNADIIIESHNGPIQGIVNQGLQKLHDFLLDNEVA